MAVLDKMARVASGLAGQIDPRRQIGTVTILASALKQNNVGEVDQIGQVGRQNVEKPAKMTVIAKMAFGGK